MRVLLLKIELVHGHFSKKKKKKKKKQNLVTCTMLIQNSNQLSPITFFWDFSPMSSQKKENITPTARSSEA
jgi:hypothetical protein